MPLSEVQGRVLRLLAANRSPDSYLAGATVLHRAPNSPRYSLDLDSFHDFVDMLHLDRTYLPLGALVWAACGKDPGYTPDLLLEHSNRHACYTQEAINLLSLKEPLDIKTLDRIQAGERYDLILFDLMMPSMTGMDLYEALGKVAPDQAERMVFMTGGAFTARARVFLEEVPNPRVEKPFDLASLQELINARTR